MKTFMEFLSESASPSWNKLILSSLNEHNFLPSKFKFDSNSESFVSEFKVPGSKVKWKCEVFPDFKGKKCRKIWVTFSVADLFDEKTKSEIYPEKSEFDAFRKWFASNRSNIEGNLADRADGVFVEYGPVLSKKWNTSVEEMRISMSIGVDIDGE